MAEVFPIVYTQGQADKDCRVWEKWIEEGYPKLKAMVDDNIARWQAVRLIAQNALEYTRGAIDFTIDPEDEIEDAPLDEFVITLDCCPISPEKVENLNLSTDPQNVEKIKSTYAEKIWNAITDADTQYKRANPKGCSPQIEIDIASLYGDLEIVSFLWDSKGGVGAVDVTTTTTPPGGGTPVTTTTSTQMVHMLTYDLDGKIYGVTGGWVEQCAFALSFGEGAAKQAFRYPSGEKYNLATIPAPALNQKTSLPINMQVSGRLIEIPSKLGCAVTPAVPGWMNGGMEIEEGWHFAAWVMNYQYQDWLFARRRPPAANPYFCDILPAGYQKFLSLYVDHPLITRENLYKMILTGLVVRPTVITDTAAVSSGTCRLEGRLVTVEGRSIHIPRPTVNDFQQISVTVNASGLIVLVRGTEHTEFSTAEGTPGGPPIIPATSLLLGTVKYSSRIPRPIIEAEIVRAQKTPEQEQAELDEVQAYVNTTFERFFDEYEDWHFLNPQTFTDGDCEDFALTKAQMLIEKGWDVKRLKLEGGWYSYLPDIGEDPEIQWQGHLWLVVDDEIALDVNEDSLATLRARYKERRVIQTNEIFDSVTVPGKKICWWEQVDDHALLYKSADQRMIKIEPYPTVSFDMPMWDLTGEIERTK